MSEEKTPEINLREFAIKSLVGSDVDSAKILECLAAYPNNDRPNDIIYALLLEMELLHRAMERSFVRFSEQHTVMRDNLIADYDERNRKMMEIVAEQQILFRSQFRRLVAIHRERFLIRVLVFSSMLLISLLAGLGIFYLYSLLVR